jgi:hypothetical protein
MNILSKVSIGLLTAGALYIGGAVGYTAYVNNQPEWQTIYSSTGGSVFEFIGKYNEWDDKGIHVKVDGPCISACTYVLGLINPDHICAGDDASFWFHGIYLGGTFNKEMVEQTHPMVFPEHVIQALKDRGFDGTVDVDKTVHPLGFIILTPEEVGVKPC